MALIGYARFHPRTNRRGTARRATQGRVYPHLRGNRLGREPRSAAARSSCPWSDPGSWTGPCFTPPSLGPSRPWFWSGIRTSSTRSSPWLRGAWNGTVPRTSKRRKKRNNGLGTAALQCRSLLRIVSASRATNASKSVQQHQDRGRDVFSPALASIHPLTHSATGAEIALFGTSRRFDGCCF